MVYLPRDPDAGALVDIRILGPTEVRHDGSSVALRGAKPRQLLVLLAIRANRPVPTEQLIEELWEGEPPPSAATALRVHFGRLRSVLEPDRSPSTASVRLPAGPHGYRLRVEPGELDAERFERGVLAARRANAEGDPGGAVPLLTDALDLWRGPALTDVRDLSAGRSETTRLEELHGVAFEELVDARLALGEHALVVDVISAAIELYPLREKLTAGLMVALYRGGRVSDALRAYTALARRLDDQLGVIPSEALRRLEEDVLLQRSTLDLVPAPAASSPMHLHPPAIRMTGRHEELRDLVTSVCTPPNEKPRLTVAVGPAGIGKSTLIKELGSRLERDGFRVVVGTCEPHPPDPFAPFGHILRLVEGDGNSADGEPEPEAEFTALEKERNDTVLLAPDADHRTAQFRLFETVAHGLAGDGTTTVVVVEDLHLADRLTLQLLRHLVRHSALARVPFVATYRDDDISGERLELIQSLAPPSQCRVLRLRPFHDGEVRSLIRAIAPPESVGVLADHASTIRGVTGGNPLFLRELLRELDDEGMKLVNGDDLNVALARIAPAGVRALIDRRVERLTEYGRHVVHMAAALDEGISTELLADACGRSVESVLDSVEECLAVRLLVEDLDDFDSFRFPHALVRNAVYAEIPRRRRTEIHREIAQALSRRPAGYVRVSTLARHFCEAAPLGLQMEAATYAERAGVDAERHLMFAQAASWYEQAMHWRSSSHVEDGQHGRLQFALGRAYAYDKRHDQAQKAFLDAADTARRIGDPALLADIALTADGPWSSGSEFRAAALPLLEEALESLDDGDGLRRVRVLAGIASDLYFADPEREGDVASRAVEIASRLDDPVAFATARMAMHRWLTHDPTARSRRLALSRSACAALGPTEQTGELFLQLQRAVLADLLENGEIVEFQQTMAQYEDQATVLCSPRDIYWSMALRATEKTIHGDLPTAEQLARGAALRGHELDQVSDGALLLQRFVIRYQQGRLAEELPVLRQVHRADSVFRAGASLAATALSETGRQARAMEVTRMTLGADGSELPRDVFWLGAVALFSGVAAQSDDRELQQVLSRLLEPCADHVVVFGAGGAVLGSAHHWLGLLASALGHPGEAVRQFDLAEAMADQIEAPFWAAQAQMEASRVLAIGGDGSDSGRRAQAAMGTARALGFGRILRQAPEAV
jgi:DNA-binding SARP family transcriptional activator/tetratricopeptide (TPR) repeat protein